MDSHRITFIVVVSYNRVAVHLPATRSPVDLKYCEESHGEILCVRHMTTSTNFSIKVKTLKILEHLTYLTYFC